MKKLLLATLVCVMLMVGVADAKPRHVREPRKADTTTTFWNTPRSAYIVGIWDGSQYPSIKLIAPYQGAATINVARDVYAPANPMRLKIDWYAGWSYPPAVTGGTVVSMSGTAQRGYAVVDIAPTDTYGKYQYGVVRLTF